MLGDRNGPVYPRTLRSWMMCPATTRTPEPPCQPCGGGRLLASYARGQAYPGQLRARLIRPKSCRDHLAAEVLLTLI